MSVYGNIPSAGDRVIWLVAANPEPAPHSLGVSLTLSQGINNRHRNALTLSHLMLVEGIITGVHGSVDVGRQDANTVMGSMTVAFNAVNDTAVRTANAWYGYYSILSAVNNMRQCPAFASFSDDDLRTLLTLCFPQLVGSAEYCKLIKDVRGDQALPASVRIDLSNAAELATRLGIQFSPFTMESRLMATAGYYSGDDHEQEQILLRGIEQDFRNGRIIDDGEDDYDEPSFAVEVAPPTLASTVSGSTFDWSNATFLGPEPTSPTTGNR